MVKAYVALLTPKAFKIYIIIFIILLFYSCMYRLYPNTNTEGFNSNKLKKEKKNSNGKKRNKLKKIIKMRNDVLENMIINKKKETDMLMEKFNDTDNYDSEMETKILNLERELDIMRNEKEKYEELLTIDNESVFKRLIEVISDNERLKDKIKIQKQKDEIENKEDKDDNNDNAQLKDSILEDLRKQFVKEYDYENKKKQEIENSKQKFIDDENKKLGKYNKAMKDYLDYQEKERKKIMIDPIKIGTDIESGLSLIYNNLLSSEKNGENKKKIFGLGNKNNIYVSKDGPFVEGFSNLNESRKNSQNNDTKNNSNNKQWSLSGFIQYIIENISDLFINGNENDNDIISIFKNKINIFKKILNDAINDGNAMSLGVVFIVVSFILFFIDITS